LNLDTLRVVENILKNSALRLVWMEESTDMDSEMEVE
jgi:aspartate/tyrosine/aromatic aminotransferase